MLLRNFVLVFLFLCLSSIQGYGQGWERVFYQFSPWNLAYANRTLVLPNGELLCLINQTQNTGDFYLIRLSAAGETLQEVKFDFLAYETANDISATSDGGFVVLYTRRDANIDKQFVLKLDAQLHVSGNFELTFGENSYHLLHIIETSSGYLIYGTKGISTGHAQFVAIQTDVFGNLEQNDQWGTDYAIASELKRLADGSFVAAGYNYVLSAPQNARINMARLSATGTFLGEFAFDPSYEVKANDMALAADGAVVLAGERVGAGAYAVKFDANNDVVWEKTYPDYTRILSITSVPDGSGYWAAARSPATAPSFFYVNLLRLDAEGNLLFSQTHGSNDRRSINYYDLESNGAGCVFSGAQYAPDSSGLFQPWVIAVDSLGNGYNSGVSGRIWYDQNADCQINADSFVRNWKVDFWKGQTLAVRIPQKDGPDYFTPLAPGNYKATITPTSNGWFICQDTLDITVPPDDTLLNQDFLVRFVPQPIDSICGVVFQDFDKDCNKDLFDSGNADWPIVLRFWKDSGGDTLTFSTLTDAAGHFCITNLPGLDNSYRGKVLNPWANSDDALSCHANCTDQFSINFLEKTGVFIPIGLICDSMPPCPQMEVDVATNRLRPCFSSTYSVIYRNKGAQTALNAQLVLTIDTALIVTGFSIPWSSVNANQYTFLLGNVASEQSGEFQFFVKTPCDAPLGATYCVEAHAYPDSLCSLPGPQWDGSEIQVSTDCTGDSVVFTIQNIGSNAMAQAQDYVIIEDNVLLMQTPGFFQLDAGEKMQIAIPADGKFFRIETKQSPGFPGHNLPAAWVEGCGTGAAVSLGFVNQYALPDEEPWLDIFCLESVNSYDPNDKNGFPRGYGAEYFINQNTDIEYIIRFQNNGTAPAINVEIRDTLPIQQLDINTVRPGASSHPYAFDVQGNGFVVFRFPNIYLPDTSQGLDQSQGFVKFRVSQHPNLTPGAKIRNSAAIYFDQNTPVITNPTLHRVGKAFIVLESLTPLLQNISISAAPNPTSGDIRFNIGGISEADKMRLIVWSLTGRIIFETPFIGTQYDLDAGSLPPGIYMFTLQRGNEPIGRGKMVKI